ncbi:MAG: hypothetical protein V4547_18205 [Bacteroidota bacterium]
MLLSVNVKAQSNQITGSTFTVGTSYTLTNGYTPCTYIVYDTPNTIGELYVSDSLCAIKKLFAYNEKLQNEIDELNVKVRQLTKDIDICVEFTNNIPDYFRSKEGNCKAVKFDKMTKRRGYITVKTKTNRAACK